MSKLVFSLKDVPEQEAEDIRQLLTDHEIPWYETSEGRWKIAVAAIWLPDDNDYARARELIDSYQQTLQETRQQQPEHRQPVSPTVFIVYIAAVIIVLAVTLLPFLRLS